MDDSQFFLNLPPHPVATAVPTVETFVSEAPMPIPAAPPAAPVDLTPPPPPASGSLPPYDEMITVAITALKERDGSSRQAIAKYIERVYANLPPPEAHNNLLTNHLRRMKSTGQLLMLNRSYKLPTAGTSATPTRSDDPNSAPANDTPIGPVSNGSSGKRGRGRPKRSETQSGTFGNINELGGQQQPFDASKIEVVIENSGGTGTGVGTATSSGKRRGRPPKSASPMVGLNGKIKKKPGRKPKAQTQAQAQGHLDPEPVAVSLVPYVPFQSDLPNSPPAANSGSRPRGRPRRITAGKVHPAANETPRTQPSTGKKRGRPFSLHKKAAAGSSPSTGGLKSNGMDMMGPAVPQWMVDYYQVQGKLRHVQSRMSRAVGLLRPHLIVQAMSNDEVAIAMQELDEIATMDILRAQLNQPAQDGVAQPGNANSQGAFGSAFQSDQPIPGAV